MKYLSRIKFHKSDKVFISMIVVLVIGLIVSLFQLDHVNSDLESTQTKLTETQKREEFTDKSNDMTSFLEQEYRSRLIDLQKFIGSPEKIKYELPYDTNDCSSKFPELQKCVIMDRSYYENNVCLHYNKVKVTENGTEPATPADKKAYDDCRAIYTRQFEAWNPN